LVVLVAVFQVDFVVLAVCSLHHVVVVDCGDMLYAAAKALCGENLLLRADNVDSFFRLVNFVLKELQEAAVG
jgi:hypothetical protein